MKKTFLPHFYHCSNSVLLAFVFLLFSLDGSLPSTKWFKPYDSFGLFSPPPPMMVPPSSLEVSATPLKFTKVMACRRKTREGTFPHRGHAAVKDNTRNTIE